MSPFLDDQLGRKRRHKLYLGIVVAIALSVSLAVAKLVVLKMPPVMPASGPVWQPALPPYRFRQEQKSSARHLCRRSINCAVATR
jgi:hypothetical protein